MSDPDGASRGPGRPRDLLLDAAILTAAERELEERGFAGMSMESVARGAGTSVPTLRRRYRNKAELAGAVIDSLRLEPLPDATGIPRQDVLAVLENFQRNLRRPRAMAVLGTLLAEEHRNPSLLERFRTNLVQRRRAALQRLLRQAVSAGEWSPQTDVEVAVNMLIGSFYARYVSGKPIPRDWARRTLDTLWPE